MIISWQLFIAFIGGSCVTGLLIWFSLKSWLARGQRKHEESQKLVNKQALLELQLSKAKTKELYERKQTNLKNKIQTWKIELKKRESLLAQSLREFEIQKAKLEDKNIELIRVESEVSRKKNNVENMRELYRKRLIQLAGLSEEKAQELLKEQIRKDCEDQVRIIKHDVLSRSLEEIEDEARRVVVSAMQRMAAAPASNLSTALIRLPNEEMKGRLIGKEGRNIKSFESATGTTLLVDETPGTVIVSSFDPIRREIAKLALQHLIDDGRINPVHIEDSVAEAQQTVDKHILMLGEKATQKLKMTGVHQDVLKYLGRLHYHHSNNQNTLEHTIEVAFLCSLMASELNLDPTIAKRCGLFHDLGKAMPCEFELSHANVASQLLKRLEEDPRVVNAVASSHGEVPSDTIYAELLKIADALSATRPGARCDSIEGYVQRIRNLEEIASSFAGVQDCYAIQAGRELRIIVSPEHYQDSEASLLASKIKVRIEEELQYPGSIRVTVIREQRFVDTAN